jgi:predicted enzyme related to lactoylglutathione lyase
MNRVVHFEVYAKDLDKAQQFYNSVFGWKITDLGPQMGHYRMVETGENAAGDKWPGINGGMNPRQGNLPVDGQAVNAFVCTISVDALDEYLIKVQSAGGTIAVPKMEIPGVGWLAYCKDIEGNIFGMMQPG